MRKFYLLSATLCLFSLLLNAQENRALQITVNDTWFEATFGDGMNVITADLTIEGWVRFDATVNDFTGLFDMRNSDGQESNALMFKAGPNLSYEWSYWDYPATDTEVPMDEWAHVAIVVSGDDEEVNLYVDGVLLGTETSSENEDLGKELPLGVIYRLGNSNNDLTRTIIGGIDEVRIWTIARTEDEINENMEMEIDPSSEGLLAYYKCNEDEGSDMLEDATGNGYDLPVKVGATGYEFVDDVPFELPVESIENVKNSQNVTTFPNPVKDVLNFNKDFQNSVVKIFDISGQLVQETVVNSSAIDISGFESGVYLLNIKEGANTYNGKFIKE